MTPTLNYAQYFEAQLGQEKFFYVLSTIEDYVPSIKVSSIKPNELSKLDGLIYVGDTAGAAKPVPRFADSLYQKFHQDQSKPKMSTKEAIEHITAVINDDRGYAWSWSANLAMAFYDEGVTHEVANRGAARFMQNLFGVDVTKYPEWEDLEAQWSANNVS